VVIVILVVIAIITGMIIGINKQEKIKQLKENYDEALSGTDKKTVVDAGRAYYSALREDGKLTIYDEQAIANDLASMKDQ